MAVVGREEEGGGTMGTQTADITGPHVVDVVGESFYQETIEKICGGRTEEGVDHECIATLRRNPNNPHDPNAIEVHIGGKQVGHTAKEMTSKLQDFLRQCDEQGIEASCGARVMGGWDRGGGDRGHFGVQLHLRDITSASPDEVLALERKPAGGSIKGWWQRRSKRQKWAIGIGVVVFILPIL